MTNRTRHVSETRSGEQHNYLTFGAVVAAASCPNPIIRRWVRQPHLRRRRRRRRLRGVEEDAAVEVRGRGEAGAAVAEERGVEPEVQPARGRRRGVPGDAAIPSGDGVEGRREVGPQRRRGEAALPPSRRRLAHPPVAGGRGHVIEVHRGVPVAFTRRTCGVNHGGEG